jgi:hypothetical protein
MDNSGNRVSLDAYNKLNNIIRRTYQCVTDKKKKKKSLHNTKLGQLQEDWDTYKYSDYPESGISPDQHAPPAAAGQQAAAPAAPPAAPAAGLPAVAAAPIAATAATAATAPAAGGVPLLAAAPAGPVYPAAPPGPLPFAAAAAALPAEFAIPAEWQDLYPLPPDSSDSSITDEFFDAKSANSTQNDPAALGEDGDRLEGQGAQDHGTHRLETDPDDHHSEPGGASLPFRGFTTPPHRVTFNPQLEIFEEESEPEDEEAEPPGESRATGAVGRRTRGDLAQALEIDPTRATVDQQALYYDALLDKIDRHTEEASRALQALQGALPHEQLRQRTAIGQRSRVLWDELQWAEHHLRPEALETVRHCRQQPIQQPPVRGQVFADPHSSAPASSTPVLRPSGPRQSIQNQTLFPPLRATGPRPPFAPSGSPVMPTRGASARQPPPPTDRVLRSQDRPHPDGRHPDPSSRGSRR